MRRPPTVYDVAERAGVSIATVSRYFRSPDAVRAVTRDRVRVAVADLGYVPSESARGLAERRTGTIGLYFAGYDDVPELLEPADEPPAPTVRVDDDDRTLTEADLYQFEVIRGAEIEAWRQGFAVTIAVPRGGAAEQAVESLAGRVDGLIALAGAVPADRLERLARRLPVVVLAGDPGTREHDVVGSDSRGGMRALTEHLLAEHGLTDLHFVAGPPASPDSGARFAGFRAALEAAGLPVPDVPTTHGDFTRPGGRAVGHAYLEAGTIPRGGALVCANDQMALGVLDVLVRAGVRVPEDVVVTGFDGIDSSALATPRLTTVRQEVLDVGRVAVRTVLHRLADRDAPVRSRLLGVEVLLRDSCGRHPG